MPGRGKVRSWRARVRVLWVRTQRTSVLVATADGQWVLTAQRLVIGHPWALPIIQTEGPFAGPDPRALLQRMGVSRPDYVVPPHQIVRHLAYPMTVKTTSLPALLRLEGSRHTPFAAEYLAMSYRRKRPPTGAERQEVAVSYCPQAELTRLRTELGPHGPRWGFLAAFDASEGDGLLRGRWWRPWTTDAGLFAEETPRAQPLPLRRFLGQALLVPLAAVLLMVPAIAVWQARLATRTQEMQATNRHMARPLRATRADLGTARRFHAELAALQRDTGRATIPQSLLPRLMRALPPSATLVALRYNAHTGGLRLQVQTDKPSLLLQALDHTLGGTPWHQRGMAQPVSTGVERVTLRGQWPKPGHP
ncbi:MAG: hypothetical protein ACYDEV_04305 [Acidiferrobacter sp.]